MSKKKKRDVDSLLKNARDEGEISKKSQVALNIADLGAQIQAGLGVDVDDVFSSEVVLVSIMPDDSGSIAFYGNEPLVRDGHNLIVDSLKSSKQKDDIFIHTRYLNGTLLYPYTTLDQATEMDQYNFNANKGTPLYDQSITLLGTVIAKSQEFSSNGVPVRTITLIISDGADASSRRANASDVKNLVEDMHRSEKHIVAAMGIDDGKTDFIQVFSEMGIPSEWILTPSNSATEIRKAFQVFSQSAMQLSGGMGAVAGFMN